MDGGGYNPTQKSSAPFPLCASAVALSADPEIRVTLAGDVVEMAMCWAIRATVFLTLPGRRFAEQFDPNDFSAAHLLVYVDGEPVGTMRLRYFCDFVRFERLAIRDEFRNLKVFRALVRYAMALCAAKGYRTVIGVSRPKGLGFWKRLGAETVGAPITYLGETVYPMTFDPQRLGGGVNPDLEGGAARAGDPAFEKALAMAERALVSLS